MSDAPQDGGTRVNRRPWWGSLDDGTRVIRHPWRKSLAFVVFLAWVTLGQTQNNFYGPVFGGVTDHSLRCVVATTTPASVQLELRGQDPGQVHRSAVMTTTEAEYRKVILNVDGLEPDSRYNWRILINGQPDSLQGQVRTFPAEGTRGNFVFVTGSCQETPNMKTFDRMAEDHPYFLLHTGDYTYPDYQIRPDYSGDYDLMAESYRRRYTEDRMQEMLYNVPIDYIYDDNDYVGGGGGRYYKNDNWSDIGLDHAEHGFRAPRFPDFWRRNCIRGYSEFFPGYPLPDTSVAIHHSFRFANAEIFFLDRNSAKPYPNSYAFRVEEGHRERIVFDPPADHVLYGQEQMNWLREGLKNSTADWKFIVSGVPFNPALRKLIDTGIRFQNTGWKGNSGIRIAAGFANYWAGHPAEQDSFLVWCEQQNLRDVIFISGDTHHNVLDDGTNSFYPEINASGLSVEGTHLAKALDWTGKISRGYDLKREVWNGGGNGIGNNNYKNAYGRISISGSDHVDIEVVDEDGAVIGMVRVPHSTP